MKSSAIGALCVLVVLIGMRLADGAENWPQWRGPAGNGTSDSTNLPTEWNLDKNIVWRAELPSWSGGTPVVWGDRVFVTSPTKPEPRAEGEQAQASESNAQPADRSGGRPEGAADGRRERGERGGGRGRGGFGRERRDPGGAKLMLMCFSRKDGAPLWQRELDDGNRTWNKHNASSPSPVTDGKHVWVVTGTGAVAAFDMDGNEVWKRNLQDDYGRFGLNWGYASSPLLYDGNLVIEVLHGNNTDDPSYIVALDGATGEPKWRVERPTDAVNESPDAYTTPALLTHDGRQQIVISGGDYVTGHDPATGEELWRAAGLNPRRERNFRIIGSPVVMGDMIYAPTRKTPLLALRAGGSGDVTTSHLAWKWEGRGAPDVPTPVADGQYFYMVDDQGLVTCLDAKGGEVVWGPERTALGTVSASPLLADGKLYITNEEAVTTVLAAGPEFKAAGHKRTRRQLHAVIHRGGGPQPLHPHVDASVLHRRVTRRVGRVPRDPPICGRKWWVSRNSHPPYVCGKTLQV